MTSSSIGTPRHQMSVHSCFVGSTTHDGPCTPRGCERLTGSGRVRSPSENTYSAPSPTFETRTPKTPGPSSTDVISYSPRAGPVQMHTRGAVSCGAHTENRTEPSG